MTRSRLLPVLVLAVALAALGASIAWAVSRDAGGHMRAHHAGRTGWMMGWSPSAERSAVRSLADARAKAQAFADRLKLKTDEVLQFERNYYVKLVDARGNGATEVLVDPPAGIVSLEYGPAMMWNTRYGVHDRRATRGMMNGGMMGRGMMNGAGGSIMDGTRGGMMNGTGAGMMNGSRPVGQATRPASRAGARAIAQRWLDANRSGVRAESGGDRFPGYYTFETLRDGRIDGMISVNASTGAVWWHWWHGAFVAEA